MGDEEAAPYAWTSTEPLMEGQDEPAAGTWVKAAGRCVGRRRARARACTNCDGLQH
jgi:hypothetical protein